jgi:hypothetical protein
MKKLVFVFIFSILSTCSLMAIDPQNIIASGSGYVKNVDLPGSFPQSLAFDMDMQLPFPMHLLVQLRYCAPESYALNVFEGDDLTPIMIVRGRTAMINDPLQSKISLIASAGVSFDLSPQGDQFNANFAFNMPIEGKGSNRVKMDFLSLFSRLENDLTASATADGLIRLGGSTAQKSSCVAIFAASQSLPLQHLEIFVENNPQPVLVFSKISADEKIASGCFLFPMEDLKNSEIEFVEIQPDGMIDTMLVVAAVMKAIFTRAALANEAFRSEVEKQLQISPDWETMHKNDKTRSAGLKKVFTPF